MKEMRPERPLVGLKKEKNLQMETTKCKITRKKDTCKPLKNNKGSTNSPDVVQDGMNIEI
jgi:hypothetical protein